MKRKKKNKEHKKLESFLVDTALLNQITCLECELSCCSLLYLYRDWYIDRFGGDGDLMSLFTVGQQYTLINKDTGGTQKVVIEYFYGPGAVLNTVGKSPLSLNAFFPGGIFRFKLKKVEEVKEDANRNNSR